MDKGLNNPSNRSSEIIEHLLNNYECINNYNDSSF